MQAIYKGKLYQLGDDLAKCTLIGDEDGDMIRVPFGDPDLIIDPTTDEINNILPDYES